MAANVKKQENVNVDALIDELVKNAQQALDEYMKLDQQQVDDIVHHMALAGLDNHMKLEKMAID